MTAVRWCGECATESVFERLECSDHGQDCPELVCTACGAGVELAPIVPPAPTHRVSTAA